MGLDPPTPNRMNAGMPSDPLFTPLTLPCGIVLKNRIAKAAMSDSLGDGRGDPTATQIRLYERWAEGGAALSIVGEVQGHPGFAEKPGNLVLGPQSDDQAFRALTTRGQRNGAQLWAQLGHAGALAHPPISMPKGPSALDLPGLRCAALSTDEIAALPETFAQTATRARNCGFGGVEIHAAHGFLLSQFLSPLFNRRTDGYGGPLEHRMRLPLEVIDAVRAAVGPDFPIGLKMNATDQLDGGLTEDEALEVLRAVDGTGIDLIDISGGTYFPGATSASDSVGGGPYFAAFARKARAITRKPLMLTGGFKTYQQARDAIADGTCDMVGLARALALDPALPDLWQRSDRKNVVFPKFENPPEGGITAWYTMRLTAIGEDRETDDSPVLDSAMADYEDRDAKRVPRWNAHFGATRR